MGEHGRGSDSHGDVVRIRPLAETSPDAFRPEEGIPSSEDLLAGRGLSAGGSCACFADPLSADAWKGCRLDPAALGDPALLGDPARIRATSEGTACCWLLSFCGYRDLSLAALILSSVALKVK